VTVWDDAWEILSDRFRRIASSLMKAHPTMTWSCGHSDNESFPFRAYASFSGRGRQETDVVISVDVLRRDDGLQFSSDLALEDGQILADGPSGVLQLTADTARLRMRIEETISQIADFILSSEAVIDREIREVRFR
jgi:hypothetical protein